MTDTITYYHARAAELSDRYETVSAEQVHGPFLDLLSKASDLLALDVGAGSGRDTAWLASLGYDVVAVEPAKAMREAAVSRHSSPRIRWLDDRLPALEAVHRLGLGFDLVLLSAVWMHVPPGDRTRAFRKVATLLKPGGVLLISLREGPSEPERPMWPAPTGEIEMLARSYGLAIIKSVTSEDQLGGAAVKWTTLCLQLPDDGAGALPLLRGIILNDDKSSTYKLGLLRAIGRIADTAPALAMPRSDADVVDLPLGLVALFWIRQYLPLVSAGLPQRPGNSGPDGLGFAGPGFRGLLATGLVGQDLRIGARFSGDRALALARALGEARSLIAEMPAHYTTFPNSSRSVFEATPRRALRGKPYVEIERELLLAYGTLSVPGPVWRSLQRLGAWVEPVLTTEWARLMRAYGDRMGRSVGLGQAEAALAWLDPSRDTMLARSVVERQITRGETISCVWTGARLNAGQIDIDHCLPWSAWPCGDLWNLLPTSRHVNQRLKRDRLPSAETLAAARQAITGWWYNGWMQDEALCHRFQREAVAALPLSEDAAVDDVFDGVAWRRLRLRQDQQIEEWVNSSRTP